MSNETGTADSSAGTEGYRAKGLSTNQKRVVEALQNGHRLLSDTRRSGAHVVTTGGRVLFPVHWATFKALRSKRLLILLEDGYPVQEWGLTESATSRFAP